MSVNEKNASEAIDRFLADHQDFEVLCSRLSEFNVFQALKIDQIEIRHSNVLAWLLDPEESHGLRDMALRRVLSNILLLSDKSIHGLTAGDVEMMDFPYVEVLREWHNIDILVIDRSNKIILFIENKIHSGESKGQLNKYKNIIVNSFVGFKIVPVFLTLTGQDPHDTDGGDYICYSHGNLYRVLKILFEQQKSKLAQNVQFFMQHYLDTLRRLTMQDQNLMELCKKIYRKHKLALDTIFEYGKASDFKRAVEALLEKENEFEILSAGVSSVWFVPKSWANIIPENGIAWTHLKRPLSIACWFETYKDTIYSHFEVSKMNDPDLRLKIIKSLDAAGFKFTAKAFEKNATYSRFYGASHKINGTLEYDNLYSTAENLLKKAKLEFPKAEAVFREIFESNQQK